MTTKDSWLSNQSKQDRQISVNDTSSDERFNNLKLTPNCSNSNVNPVSSKSVTVRKVQDNAKHKSIEGMKFNKSLSSNLVNILLNSGEKEVLKEANNSDAKFSNSTLSLYIEAYENSSEAFMDSSCENEGLKNVVKNLKEAFIVSSLVIQNPFEFPRQQNDKVLKPETSQFKASQQLFNPNQSISSTKSLEASAETPTDVLPQGDNLNLQSEPPVDRSATLPTFGPKEFAASNEILPKVKEESAENVQENKSLHFLRLSNLPYSATEGDVRRFFEGLAVDEVQFGKIADGRPSGEALVGFQCDSDAGKGFCKDKEKIGSRNIRVFRNAAFTKHQRKSNTFHKGGYRRDQRPTNSYQNGSGDKFSSTAIRARGLPYSCTEQQMQQFFNGITIEELVFGYDERARLTGEAYLKFRTVKETFAAMKFDRASMEGSRNARYIELFRSTMEEFEAFKRHMKPKTPPRIRVAPSIVTATLPPPVALPPPVTVPPPSTQSTDMEWAAYTHWFWNEYWPAVGYADPAAASAYGLPYAASFQPSQSQPQQARMNYYDNFYLMNGPPPGYNMQAYPMQSYTMQSQSYSNYSVPPPYHMPQNPSPQNPNPRPPYC